MKIFRHKRNGLLYTIEYVKPMMYTGSWYVAVPYGRQGKDKNYANLDDYELVSER